MNPFDVLIKRRVRDVDGDEGMSKSASHDKVLSSLSKNSDPDLHVSHKKRQGVLIEIKKVFQDLDLPWTDEDFKSLSITELEAELEKALPLLQDEDLLKEVEEARQARQAQLENDYSKLWVHPNGMIYSDGSMFRNVDDRKTRE